MDPYVYPGTNILKNRRDLRDLESLSTLEAFATGRRIFQLSKKKKPTGKFDLTHLKQIHGYIFQDVYEWAGQFRTVNIARPGQFFFAFHHMISPCLETAFAKLASERLLERLAVDAFTRRAAYYMGELNAVHPFRDGNGRTQREFIRQLGIHNSYIIRWSRVTREQMGAGSKSSFQSGDLSGLTSIIQTALDIQ
jgi:cell filamentation protein